MKGKRIVDHEIVKVIDTGSQYEVLIRLSKGGWIRHNPFKRDAHGLVGATSLSVDVLAGKFFPSETIDDPDSKDVEVEGKVLPGPVRKIGSSSNN